MSSIIPVLICSYGFNVATFNIHADRANLAVIAEQIAEQNNISIWGLTESNNKWAPVILKKLNKNLEYPKPAKFSKSYKVLLGTTGGSNKRLQLYYDTKQFVLLEHQELDYINKYNRVRAPLVAKLQDKNSGQNFLVVVNHLYRNNARARHEQAKDLNHWALQQQYPVIALGDYNFDMSTRKENKHGRGYTFLTKNNVFTWVKPEEIIPTHCSHHRSILDFVFLTNNNLHTNNNFSWRARAKILYPSREYCQHKNYFSDHRPVIANITYNYDCKNSKL